MCNGMSATLIILAMCGVNNSPCHTRVHRPSLKVGELYNKERPLNTGWWESGIFAGGGGSGSIKWPLLYTRKCATCALHISFILRYHTCVVVWCITHVIHTPVIYMQNTWFTHIMKMYF